MNSDKIISAGEFFRIIKKRLNIVILITLLVTTAGAAATYFAIPPIYQTKLTVFIGNTYADDVSEQMDSVILYQSLMKTYVEIAKSDSVAEKTIAKLKLNVTSDVLKQNISVTEKQGTQLVVIKSKSKDAAEALKVINSFGEAFIEEGKRMYSKGDIKIVDNAKLPTKPVSPNTELNILIAFVLGGALSMLIILLMEIWDRTIKTEEDIERYLKLPVFGLILKQPYGFGKAGLESVSYPKSASSEAFRTLRTNIEFSSSDNKIKSIVITSSNPNEGKSTVAANLAVVMAQAGKNTLLIDCDQRNPNIHKIFNLTNQKGLSNFLAGAADLNSVFSKTEINNLLIITSGVKPPNPAELLLSEKMKQFVAIIGDKFDYVVMDTPPVGLVTDAQILSQYADGCLIVLASGDTDREAAVRAKELLQKVNTKILGVVLNKFNVKDSAHYSGGNYYHSYFSDDAKAKLKKKKKQKKDA